VRPPLRQPGFAAQVEGRVATPIKLPHARRNLRATALLQAQQQRLLPRLGRLEQRGPGPLVREPLRLELRAALERVQRLAAAQHVVQVVRVGGVRQDGGQQLGGEGGEGGAGVWVLLGCLLL